MTRRLSGSTERIPGPYELFAAGRTVLTLMRTVAQRFRNRRAVVTLLDWDDRALRDIGLTRADVQLSLALPLTDDPSQRLMYWTAERRDARHKRQRDLAKSDAAPQLRLVSGRHRSSTASISR